MVWRYHPDTQHFEIYAEGGGNTFSLEIDAVGRVFSGTNNDNTRGMYYPREVMGKRVGASTTVDQPLCLRVFPPHVPPRGPEPFCPGFFASMVADSIRRIMMARSLPPMPCTMWYGSANSTDTSTWRTVDEANLAETDDRWFRPVFSGAYPDGWPHCGLVGHPPQPCPPCGRLAQSRGRIYRGQTPWHPTRLQREADLSTLPAEDLLSYLEHPNTFCAAGVVLEIGWRQEHRPRPRSPRKKRPGQSRANFPGIPWALNLSANSMKKGHPMATTSRPPYPPMDHPLARGSEAGQRYLCKSIAAPGGQGSRP